MSQSSSGGGSVSIFGLRHTQSYLSSCTLVVTASEEMGELCVYIINLGNLENTVWFKYNCNYFSKH